MSDYDPNFDFNGSVRRINLAMNLLGQHEEDLKKIVATVEMAHTMGPFIDPLKYRDALYRGDMDTMKKLVEALQPAVKIWNEEIVPKMREVENV